MPPNSSPRLHSLTHSHWQTHTHIFINSTPLFSRFLNHISILLQTPKAHCLGSLRILHHEHELKVDSMPSTPFCVSDFLTECWANTMNSIHILLIEKNKHKIIYDMWDQEFWILYLLVLLKIIYMFVFKIMALDNYNLNIDNCKYDYIT